MYTDGDVLHTVRGPFHRGKEEMLELIYSQGVAEVRLDERGGVREIIAGGPEEQLHGTSGSANRELADVVIRMAVG